MEDDSDLIHFLDPNEAPYEGVVAVGGSLTTTNLIRAYRRGIFPWPINERLVPWCCPEVRAILESSNLHVPRRLERLRRHNIFRITIDQSFNEVIRACATVKRQSETGTWITRRMIDAYCALHREGHAHSVEVWEGDALVGGLYGVDAGGAFAAESMFTYRSNASKLALLFLIDHLQQRGLTWLDIQVMTAHMQALGATEIDRDEFLEKLVLAQKRKIRLFDPPLLGGARGGC